MNMIFAATATPPPDAARMPNMGRYPDLVYGPTDDPKVRFASNGKPIEDLAADPATRAAIVAVDDLARSMGVPMGDVCDALKFLRDKKAI